MESEIILQGKYNKEEDDYIRKKLIEYYVIYPNDKESESNSQDYHSNIPNYEERCKKIRDHFKRHNG